MLTIEQLKTMLLIRNQAGTLFSNLDRDIFQRIIFFCEYSPDIDKALHLAAYARKKDVEDLLAMLEKDPTLLLGTGNVITPGGLEVQRVTILEFLLGAGDPDFVAQVIPFFSKIPGGEEECERQLKRYRPHIENMLTQAPYDIQPIFNLLLNPRNNPAIREDVRALLANNLEHASELRDTLLAFRDFHLPKKPLTSPRMHFNYATQNALFQTLYNDKIFPKLYGASGSNWDMIDFVWRQIICYLMNLYPGIDRCITAQGTHHVYKADGTQAADINRSYTLRNTLVEFPSLGTNVANLGLLGDHFGISIYGEAQTQPLTEGPNFWPRGLLFESHWRAKAAHLQSLIQPGWRAKLLTKCVIM